MHYHLNYLLNQLFDDSGGQRELLSLGSALQEKQAPWSLGSADSIKHTVYSSLKPLCPWCAASRRWIWSWHKYITWSMWFALEYLLWTSFGIKQLNIFGALTWQYNGLLKRRTSSIVSFVNSLSLGIDRSVIGFSFSSIPVASPCSAYK